MYCVTLKRSADGKTSAPRRRLCTGSATGDKRSIPRAELSRPCQKSAYGSYSAQGSLSRERMDDRSHQLPHLRGRGRAAFKDLARTQQGQSQKSLLATKLFCI